MCLKQCAGETGKEHQVNVDKKNIELVICKPEEIPCKSSESGYVDLFYMLLCKQRQWYTEVLHQKILKGLANL